MRETHIGVESGAYLPRFLTIKVREASLLPSQQRLSQYSTASTITTLPNVGIFTMLGQGGQAGCAFPGCNAWLVAGHTNRVTCCLCGGWWGDLESDLDQTTSCAVCTLAAWHRDQVLMMILSFQQTTYTHSSGCMGINISQSSLPHICSSSLGFTLSWDIMAKSGAARSSSFPLANAFPNPSIQHPTHQLSLQESANLSSLLPLLPIFL